MSRENILKYQEAIINIDKSVFPLSGISIEALLSVYPSVGDPFIVEEEFSEIILVRGKVAGYIIAHKDSKQWSITREDGTSVIYKVDDALRFRRIAIAKEFQFIFGLGPRALNRLAKRAIDRGIDKIFQASRIMEGNAEIVKQNFFKKVGFRIMGKTTAKGYASLVIEGDAAEIFRKTDFWDINSNNLEEPRVLTPDERIGIVSSSPILALSGFDTGIVGAAISIAVISIVMCLLILIYYKRTLTIAIKAMESIIKYKFFLSIRVSVMTVKYFWLLGSVVNPYFRKFTVAYGCAAADVITLWLTTRFSTAYFIDAVRVDSIKLEKYRKEWNSVLPMNSIFIPTIGITQDAISIFKDMIMPVGNQATIESIIESEDFKRSLGPKV